MTDARRASPVLVTGADGFIGSHLVERLVARRRATSARSACTTRTAPGAGSTRRRRRPGRGSTSGSATSATLGSSSEACAGVDIVFHLAALIAIPYSYVAPESFVDTNVGGTLNVLEAARPRRRAARRSTRRRARSTARRETLPIRETHPLNAQSPYAATKVAADQLALSYHRSFGLPVVVLRPFNTYGPRQSARAVVPTMLTPAAGRAARDRARAAGHAARPHVRRRHGRRLRPGGAGRRHRRPDDPARHRADASRSASSSSSACALTGVDATARLDEARLRPDASEVLVLESDPSLARELLGWSPSTTLEDGLAATIEWLRAARPLDDATVSSSEPRSAARRADHRWQRAALPRRVPRSNFVSSIGPFVTRFEREFAAFVGSRLRRRVRIGDGGDPCRVLGCSASAPATRSSFRR